jgi:thiosulfate reductase cytochrome b subunit
MSAISVKASETRIYRHALILRITHWVNAICMTMLLMSGLQIFNAHSALYWGNSADLDHPSLVIGVDQDASGKPIGVTAIGDREFDTTGILGLSRRGDGSMEERAFPAWATVPRDLSLALARRFHFFFAWLFVANGLVYLGYTIVSGHWRELVPRARDLKAIGHSIWDHLRLKFPKGDDARQYNVLQKLAYGAVVFVLAPLIWLAGLTMSPRIDASFPWLLDLFGGRQSARTIHFICAFSLLGFVVIHLVMVLVSGVWNNLRSMITGWYDIGRADHEK